MKKQGVNLNKYCYANIEELDPSRRLRPLRKNRTFTELEKLRIDLHNNLWAGGGVDFNDAFYRLIKIIFVKIYDEKTTPKTGVYQLQKPKTKK